MLRGYLKKKKRALPYLITLILVGSTLFYAKPLISTKDSLGITPTVFVHGFKGGPSTFSTMIQRLQRSNDETKRTVMVVSPDGSLSYKNGPPQTIQPFIQVLFVNNRASLNKQTLWLQKLAKTLYKDHKIEQLNLIGHSMGGLTATNFLLNNQGENYPMIKKLALIASPFEGIQRKGYDQSNYGAATVDLRPHSKALNDMLKRRKYFDKNTEVLSIAGVINEDSPKSTYWDGLVGLSSALGIKRITSNQNIQESIIYDGGATHSGLHEHKKVDQILNQFLWPH